MKKVIEIDGMTINDLIGICDKYGIPLNTRISVMGADIKYMVIDDSSIVLDECNYPDELGEEYEYHSEV